MLITDSPDEPFEKVSPYAIAGFTENNNVILETEDGERIMKHKDKLLLAHC